MRGEEFCQVSYKADKPMVCTVCRKDRKKCSKSTCTQPEPGVAAPSEPPIIDAVSAHKPAAQPQALDKSPPQTHLQHPPVQAQDACLAPVDTQAETSIDTSMISSSKLTHLHERLFELELHEERCRMRLESERSNLARAQASLFSEEVGLAQVDACIAAIEAELAAKEPIANAPAKPAGGRKSGRELGRRK